MYNRRRKPHRRFLFLDFVFVEWDTNLSYADQPPYRAITRSNGSNSQGDSSRFWSGIHPGIILLSSLSISLTCAHIQSEPILLPEDVFTLPLDDARVYLTTRPRSSDPCRHRQTGRKTPKTSYSATIQIQTPSQHLHFPPLTHLLRPTNNLPPLLRSANGRYRRWF